LIDLHLHTTASDGRLTPGELVARVLDAGITTFAVTDHDTVAGVGEAADAARAAGLEFVSGIEVTAVHDGRDVHLLGYFIDAADEALAAFLTDQRARRVDRVKEIGERLARLGAPVNIERVIARASHKPGASVGRPAVARALVRAGHVQSVHEAFERFLGADRPAYVPRSGEAPDRVVQRIHAAGGLASMAHPGVTNKPLVLRELIDAGLDAVEVYHSDHPPEVQRHLLAFAEAHALFVTGGSDFHGDESRDRPLGRSTLPRPEFERLRSHGSPR
jgi:3',5'-nucleoside bisphosphate phosphatase